MILVTYLEICIAVAVVGASKVDMLDLCAVNMCLGNMYTLNVCDVDKAGMLKTQHIDHTGMVEAWVVDYTRPLEPCNIDHMQAMNLRSDDTLCSNTHMVDLSSGKANTADRPFADTVSADILQGRICPYRSIYWYAFIVPTCTLSKGS